MKATIYHNPRCTKSRQTLALLEQRKIDFEIIEYLTAPPDQQTLQTILAQLEMSAIDFIRKGEALFKTLDLANCADSDPALIAMMIAHPILIERPIVLANGKAAIGRPPENVLAIL